MRTDLSVAVDARALELSGLGRYLREILAALLADSRFRRIELLGSPDALQRFVAAYVPVGEVVIRGFPTSLYSPRAQLAWIARWVWGLAADVTFFPHYDAPFWGMPQRSVITVHDLIHFRVPGAFPVWRRALASALLERVVHQAECVIAVSETTRRDLMRRVPEIAGRTEVVPNGVSRAFLLEDNGRSAESIWAASLRPYLLCVGNRKPHKNLAVAVAALARLRREWPNIRLVIAGRVYPGWEEVLRRAEALNVATALVDVDEPDDGTLRALYAHCEAFLFPSLYEGFGLPALEAMACGSPVVASTRAAVPEVVGDAGLLVDPLDPGGVAHAVQRLRWEAGLRAELIRRGKKRAQRFTWERAATRTLDILHEVATRGKAERSNQNRVSPAGRGGPIHGVAPSPAGR